MRRTLVVIAVGATLSVGLVIWYVLRPPVNLLIVSDAADIEVISAGFGEQVITYRAPGAAYAWRTQVERTLMAYGWAVPPPWRTDIPSHDVTHISSFWFGAILDRAELDGEPNVARITVRRWVKLPCILVVPSDGQPIHWLTSCNRALSVIGLADA